MRLVTLPLVATLALATLSGCIDFHDTCEGDSYDTHRSSAGHDDDYSYEYEYEYAYEHNGGSGHSSSHASAYAYSGSSEHEVEAEGEAYTTSCHDEYEDDYEYDYQDEHDQPYYIPAEHEGMELVHHDLAATIEPLYTGVWSGSGDISGDFAIERPYDFVLTDLVHQGQSLGDGFRYTDPEEGELDHACLTATSGQTLMTRTVPPSEGQAGFVFDGRISGQTTFNAWGYRGHTAPTYLYFLHQGQRADLPVPAGTSMDFYVPEGSGEIEISLLHQGQALLGARLYDAEGTEVAEITSSAGQEARTTTTEGTSGLWKLRIDGMRSGQFQVSIRPATVAEIPQLPSTQA